MTKKILQPYDFAGNQVIDVRFENLASFPGGASAGRAVFNTTTNKLGVHNGTEFKVLLDSVAWGDVTGKPTAFPPDVHNHVISDTTGLQTALSAKAPLVSPTFTGTVSGPTPATADNSTAFATTAYVQNVIANFGAGDMAKAAYDTNDDGKVDAADVADAAPWTGITDKPTTFPPDSHNHAIADTTGLQAALDDKAPTSHTHTASDVTDFNATVDARVIAFIDSDAGADADLDTLREILDQIKQNRTDLTDQVGRYEETFGDGVATSIAITHNLNSRDLIVQVYDTGTFEDVEVGIVRTSANVVTLGASPAPATNALRVVIRK